MFDNPGFILFVIVVIVVVGWYAWGTQYNVRRGEAALKWLQEGLPLIGEKTTLRWLGSSVVELKLAKPKDPFRAFEVMVVLEPRDIPIFWALARMNGRRDLLILRAQLARAPRFDLEARGTLTWKAAHPDLKLSPPPQSGAQTSKSRDPSGEWIAVQESLPDGVRAEYRGDISTDQVHDIIAEANNSRLKLARLSVSRSVPNLQIHFLFPKLDQSSSRVLTTVRALSERVLKI